jgi:hypothetical protein
MFLSKKRRARDAMNKLWPLSMTGPPSVFWRSKLTLLVHVAYVYSKSFARSINTHSATATFMTRLRRRCAPMNDSFRRHKSRRLDSIIHSPPHDYVYMHAHREKLAPWVYTRLSREKLAAFLFAAVHAAAFCVYYIFGKEEKSWCFDSLPFEGVKF